MLRAIDPHDPYDLRCPSVVLIDPKLSDRIDACSAADGMGRSDWIRQHLTLAVHEAERRLPADLPDKRRKRKRKDNHAEHYGRRASSGRIEEPMLDPQEWERKGAK